MANSRFVRVSPQKARLVIDLIRGQRGRRSADIAVSRRSAWRSDVEKTLRSAIANAERKAEDAGESLDVDELYVARAVFVNEGIALEAPVATSTDGPRFPVPGSAQLTSWWKWRSINAP